MQYTGHTMQIRNTQDLYPWFNGPELNARDWRIANLQGAVAGFAFRVAELKTTRASRVIVERAEHSLRAYRRMLEEALKS
jgi:hypothetical protein